MGIPFFSFKPLLKGTGGGSAKGKYVGAVTNDTTQTGAGIFVNAFPTTRLDGTALSDEDFVRVHSSATIPLTINGVVFNSDNATGYYYGGNWIVQEGIITETNEVQLKNKPAESYTGNANNQQQINQEVATRLKSYRHDQNTASETWNIAHNLKCFPSVTVVDTAGNEVDGEVKYIDENTIELKFSASFAGKAYLN